MNKFLLALFSVLMIIVVGELIFLYTLGNQKAKSNTPIITEFPYQQSEIQSSDGNFMKILNNARKAGYSLDDLSWYLLGSTMTKKNMVSQYLISVTAKGKITKIKNDPVTGLNIVVQDMENTNEDVKYSYSLKEMPIVEVRSKLGNKTKISDLKVGDSVTITDAFDMKSSTTVKALIEL